MIITSRKVLEINKIYDQDSNIGIMFQDGDKIHKNFRFLVLRKASEDEYIKQMRIDYPERNISLDENYYQISMD